jgi:CheY-like chemotaxis protein
LLAEDCPDNQRLISFFLERAGAQVALVENGTAAVEQALAARDRGTPFDVILMDMQMPETDGYQAATALRVAGYQAPIIALTACALSDDREKCMRAGCDDYVSKPVKREKLISVAAAYGNRRAGGRTPFTAGCRPSPCAEDGSG